MATLAKTNVSHLQPGDLLVINNEPMTVKYIDGPDKIGTYDINVIDQYGNSHIEIVTGLVTISL
jgi:hypothetical protein